jgi:hypothetical protein
MSPLENIPGNDVDQEKLPAVETDETPPIQSEDTESDRRLNERILKIEQFMSSGDIVDDARRINAFRDIPDTSGEYFHDPAFELVRMYQSAKGSVDTHEKPEGWQRLEHAMLPVVVGLLEQYQITARSIAEYRIQQQETSIEQYKAFSFSGDRMADLEQLHQMHNTYGMDWPGFPHDLTRLKMQRIHDKVLMLIGPGAEDNDWAHYIKELVPLREQTLTNFLRHYQLEDEKELGEPATEAEKIGWLDHYKPSGDIRTDGKLYDHVFNADQNYELWDTSKRATIVLLTLRQQKEELMNSTQEESPEHVSASKEVTALNNILKAYNVTAKTNREFIDAQIVIDNEAAWGANNKEQGNPEAKAGTE